MPGQAEAQKVINDALAQGVQPKPIDAPSYYASILRIAADTNNCTIIFQRSVPVTIEVPGQAPVDGSKAQDVAMVSMSPQTAKDLLLLLQDQIRLHEETFGVIETAFSRSRAPAK